MDGTVHMNDSSESACRYEQPLASSLIRLEIVTHAVVMGLSIHCMIS